MAGRTDTVWSRALASGALDRRVDYALPGVTTQILKKQPKKQWPKPGEILKQAGNKQLTVLVRGTWRIWSNISTIEVHFSTTLK